MTDSASGARPSAAYALHSAIRAGMVHAGAKFDGSAVTEASSVSTACPNLPSADSTHPGVIPAIPHAGYWPDVENPRNSDAFFSASANLPVNASAWISPNSAMWTSIRSTRLLTRSSLAAITSISLPRPIGPSERLTATTAQAVAHGGAAGAASTRWPIANASSSRFW